MIMMPPDVLETLHQVNGNLASALIRLSPVHTHCSAIRPQDFSDLLSEILRAAECLQCLPPNSEVSAALEQQSLEYRSNLERLHHFLPELHRNLLAEKSRLENAQTNLTSAAAWARTSQKTL